MSLEWTDLFVGGLMSSCVDEHGHLFDYKSEGEWIQCEGFLIELVALVSDR